MVLNVFIFYCSPPLPPRAGCHFTSNIVTTTGANSQASGGGFQVTYSNGGDATDSAVEVRDCHFDSNQLTSGYVAFGGGMLIQYSDTASGARLTVAGV